MKVRYELFLALRYLLAKRKQTFLSVISLISILGVATGVTALIIALALMTGFQEEIRGRILGASAHITIFDGFARGLEDYPAVMRQALGVEGVVAAAPLVLENGLLSSDTRSGAAALIYGIDPALQGEVTSLQQHLEADAETDGPSPSLSDLVTARPAAEGEPARLATVFLGSELGRTLHVKVGDRVRLIIPRARLSPFTVRPRSVSYVVAGFADSGFYDFDTTRLYMHLKEAQRLFSMGDTVTAVQVRLDDLDHTSRVRAELESRLGGAFYVNDLMEQNRAFFSALRLEKMVAFLVITLIVLVAALNIVSTLILMVMEKVRDIGALVSMGATSRSVMLVFQLQGLIIGVVGTLVGLVLGIGVSWVMDTYRLWTLNPDVYFIPYLPFKVRPLDFTLTALIAIFISFQATLYPSWRASRLDPVEALRNE